MKFWAKAQILHLLIIPGLKDRGNSKTRRSGLMRVKCLILIDYSQGVKPSAINQPVLQRRAL